MKLDPEDGEQIMEYFKTHALLTREKARKTEEQSLFIIQLFISQIIELITNFEAIIIL